MDTSELKSRGADGVVIDAHCHILPPEFMRANGVARKDATFNALFGAQSPPQIVGADELIAEMDSAGVDRSVVAGYGWTNIDAAKLSNDYILNAARRHPDRIIPFCSVNPLWGAPAVDEIKRCAAGGARGVGELHPDTQNLLGAPLTQLAPALDCARELNLPILSHASEPVGHSYPGKGSVTPEKALTLAEAFPENKFIFAHFGGGLPFYALMPEVKKALANVWFDSAAYNFLYSAAAFQVSAAAAGVERILFASDFPLVKQARALNGLMSSELSPQAKRLIAGGNAEALFAASGRSK